jgi:lipoate-protein ligase A
MHEMIRAALVEFGAAGSASDCGREIGRGAFLCFEHQTPGDVLLDGHKIVGSAQRRRAGAILQHGSILLATSPHAPQRVGVRDLVHFDVAPDRLAMEIGRTFSRATGWALVPCDWSAEMLARRAQIETERYRQPSWTERR